MSELPESDTFGDYGKWPGRDVLDPTGHRLGEVREIYLDDATDRPEWVLVETEGGSRFVPLAGAAVEGEKIRVVHLADAVTAAPTLEPSKELSQDEERRLYDHYDVKVSEEASDSLIPDPEQPAPETPAAAEPEPEPPAPEPEPKPEPAPPEPEPEPEPEPIAALPPEGETSEPEDQGPMVPPRPEPVAPPPSPPPPQPSGGDGPPPAVVVGAALAALLALLLIIRSRRD
jgi:MYXO-CTERM domain-containing protein